jgi:hypothetical protein
MKPELKLTQTDRDSPLWKKIEAHITTRRDDLRRQNDKSRSPEATEKLRGRIAELNDFLKLNPANPQEDDTN